MMTTMEFQEHIKHKIPSEEEAKSLIEKPFLTGAEVGSYMFACIMSIVRSYHKEGKGIDPSFVDKHQKMARQLCHNEFIINCIWCDLANYILDTHRVMNYIYSVAQIGLKKMVDDAINIAKETGAEISLLSPNSMFVIIDAIKAQIGWNCFLDIICDLFGIQNEVKEELMFADTDFFLDVAKTVDANAIAKGLKDIELMTQSKEDCSSYMKDLLEQFKNLHKIKKPSKAKIDKFKKSFQKSIEKGDTYIKFYGLNEGMVTLFF